MIKFFFCNRFMWLLYVWVLICLCMFSNHPYVNAALFFIGTPYIVFAFAYIQDECELNEEEERTLGIMRYLFS